MASERHTGLTYAVWVIKSKFQSNASL
uniref:Uncharacterized protein n=1 Tax=Anguilla anguilla TaxID=7936 RepID=A0A0E9SLV0_ANGAN